MPDEEKLVSHYRLKTLLRKDGFGAVYFAEDTRDQKACVLRVIELDQPTLTRITGRVRARSQRDHPLIEQIRQRVKRISELKNSHILPVIEFGEEHIQGNNDIIFYMVSPYEKASLLSYWSEHTNSAELISLEIVSELLFQAAEGLFYAHRRGLVHQYVRLSSFMLHETARSRKLHLYLTDFWFADISAALLEEGQISQDLAVYLASEQLAGHAVAASDQYALAILAYELLLGYRLSQVDLSIGLYERFVRLRGAEVSEAELQLAHSLDLVLARALAEDVSARYNNIEEFALAFKAVASGELIELEEDTAKLPVIARSDLRSGPNGVEIAAFAAGALAAGEIAGEITEEQVEDDATSHTRHASLHKTVLTAEGMESASSGEVNEETASETAQSGAVIEGAGTLAMLEEERTRSSSTATGAASFVAGLAAGEMLQRETDISEEKTEIHESSAAAFAAGEARQREIDDAEERSEIRENKNAAFAAGAAAGLIAGEALAAEQADISEEQTQIISAGSASAAYGQESNISEEQTQIIPAVGGALLAGAAALEVGEFLVSGLVGTEVAGAAGLADSGLLAGGFGETQATGEGAGGTGGMSVLDEAAMVGGAAAASLAAESASTGGSAGNGQAGTIGAGQSGEYAGGNTTGAAGAGLVAGAAGLAGAGLVAGGAGLAGGVAGGETTQAAGAGGAGLAGGVAGGATTRAAGGVGGAGLAAAGAAGLAGAGLAAEGAKGGGAADVGGAELATGGAKGGAGLAGAGLAIGGAAGGTTQAAGGGIVGGGGFATSTRGRRRRTLLAAIIIALLLLLLFGSISAYALGQSSSATVTLTLASHTIQSTYLVTATTSTNTTTTTTSGQVQANFLKQTASLSQSGQASGYYPGAEASGFIKLSNSSTGCGCPVFIPAGTAFVSGSGVTVVIDYGVSVASLCSVTVPAHAMIYGPGGDISAGNVQAAYSSHIWATNPYAFTGGQGGQNNALVQQSDIDHLASSLRAQVVQNAETNIQAQVKSNQRLFAQPNCQTRVKSDHAAGDSASSVTVTVTAVCSAEAYDYNSTIQIVQQQVQNEASSYSSDQYTLTSGLQTTVASATVTDAKAGTVLLAIKVFGKWIHKLSNNLEHYIANRSVSEARAILMQFGAARVDISVSGFNSNTLPSDSSKIKIVVKG